MDDIKKKKGDVHYVMYTNDGKKKILNSIDDVFRHDVKLIFKRTFIKTSGGQGLCEYYSNEILDDEKNIIDENTFKWNNISCKLETDERWRDYTGDKTMSVCLIAEIEDHFKTIKSYFIPVGIFSPFVNLINMLELIDRVGTHQGAMEVKKLQDEINGLENQVDRDSKSIERLKNKLQLTN